MYQAVPYFLFLKHSLFVALSSPQLLYSTEFDQNTDAEEEKHISVFEVIIL